MDLKTVFDAEPKSTWEVMCQPGAGFYIPAYQRDYAWDKDKVQRLVADSLHGLQLLVDKSDSITFIGTLIVLHDVKYLTVKPVVRGDLPSKVLLVIDGQQRLTTLALLNTVLHEELSRRIKEKEFQNGGRPAFEWLRDKTSEVLVQLDYTFRLDMTHGEQRSYPRLIRGLVDTWSRKSTEAQYRSSVASCLFAYIQFAAAGGGRRFEYEIPVGVPEEERTSHGVVARNRDTLRKELLSVADGGEEEMEFPRLDQLGENTEFQEALLKAPLPPEVIAQLCGAEGTDKERTKFEQLLRLVLFAKFMMDRVAVTVVTAKNEDYAFDMFEALNTTGEPLTAFETFRPKVIEAEGLGKYDASPSHNFLKVVEGYVGKSAKARDRHATTTNLLLPFALAETGKKLAKRLTEQRKYLRGGFDDLPDLNARREFVQHLSHSADFLCRLWPDDKEAKPELDGDQFSKNQLTLLCLDALRAANHHIPVGMLSRFYSLYRCADAADRPVARKELEEAVLAVTAFFVLWRGSRRTTANIDAQYRKIMSEGIPQAGVKAFARRPEKEKEFEVPSAAKLRAAFKHILEHDGKEVKIAGKQDWVDRAAQLDVYKQSVALARLLLYLATHDTAPDATAPGLVSKARSDSLNMLTLERWRDDLTVEHIAPQARNASGWDKGLYDDADLVNSLGNLTLSPQAENSSLGKRPWAAKRVMYQVLGTPSLDALTTRLATAKEEGIEFASSTEKILEKATYLPHLAAVSKVTGEWTPELVKQRSRRLAELAWDRVAPWLSLT
jgi:hypothetical protein